jgi:hypothetical protein
MDDKEQGVRRPSDEPKPSSDLGDWLHASFTADNQDSLSDEITHSLLHLSREEKTASMRTRIGFPHRT